MTGPAEPLVASDHSPLTWNLERQLALAVYAREPLFPFWRHLVFKRFQVAWTCDGFDVFIAVSSGKPWTVSRWGWKEGDLNLAHVDYFADLGAFRRFTNDLAESVAELDLDPGDSFHDDGEPDDPGPFAENRIDAIDIPDFLGLPESTGVAADPEGSVFD